MKCVIGVNGVDGSGKTSVIRGLSNQIKELYQPPNPLYLSDKFPKEEIPNWYRTSQPSVIVSALLDGNKRRNDLVLDKHNEFSALDRSYLTTIPACISHFMTKRGLNFKGARQKVDEINEKIGYEEISDIVILLDIPLSKKEKIDLIKSRGENVDRGYEKYLLKLIENVDRVSSEYKKIFKIDATQPFDCVLDEALKVIKNNSRL